MLGLVVGPGRSSEAPRPESRMCEVLDQLLGESNEKTRFKYVEGGSRIAGSRECSKSTVP